MRRQGEESVSDEMIPNGIFNDINDMTISKMTMTHLALRESNLPDLSLDLDAYNSLL